MPRPVFTNRPRAGRVLLQLRAPKTPRNPFGHSFTRGSVSWEKHQRATVAGHHQKLVEAVNVLGLFSVDLLVEQRANASNSAYLTSLAQEWQETGKALEYAQVFLMDSSGKELIPPQEALEVNGSAPLDSLEKRSNLIEVRQ